MKRVLFFFLWISVTASCACMAQSINQVNADGKREGLWVEKRGVWDFYIHYKNGMRDGTAYEVNTFYGRPTFMGNYTNGVPSGVWYFFDDETGVLRFMQRDFRENTLPTPSCFGSSGILAYQCYVIEYYPNGNKEKEGLLLWEGSPESDCSFEYGVWKFYDEEGNLKEVKEYK